MAALVFDIGHHSLRVGHARDDKPTAEVPSFIGVGADGVINTISKFKTKPIDPSLIVPRPHTRLEMDFNHIPQEGVDVSTYLQDGQIVDWSLFETVLDYTYSDVLNTWSADHPVLISDSPWSEKQQKENLAQLMFEKYQVPNFYVGKNAVLAALGVGRQTGVVIDSGATHTSAIAIKDSVVIAKAMTKSPIGGDYVTKQCFKLLKKNNLDIIPPYMIQSKETVGKGATPKWTKKTIPEVKRSWHSYMVKRVVQEFHADVLQISEKPYNEKRLEGEGTVHFEFPNGYNQNYGTERFFIPEVLFDPKLVTENVDGIPMGATDLVTSTIEKCDESLQSALYNGIVVTGGNSFIPGFAERLKLELSVKLPPSSRLRVQARNGECERRFGAWIGGSSLAAMDIFKAISISADDYEEFGLNIVEKKCP